MRTACEGRRFMKFADTRCTNLSHPRRTRTQTHSKHTVNKPPIPKAAAHSAAFEDGSQEPAVLCQGRPGMLTVAVFPPHFDTAMVKHGAPTPRQGNWLEMMGP